MRDFMQVMQQPMDDEQVDVMQGLAYGEDSFTPPEEREEPETDVQKEVAEKAALSEMYQELVQEMNQNASKPQQ